MSRVRNRGSSPSIGNMQMYYLGNPLGPNRETIISASDEVITDVVTPNYIDKIRAGEVINNPMHYEKHTVDSTVGGRMKSTVIPPDPVGSIRYEVHGSGCLSNYAAQHWPSYTAQFPAAVTDFTNLTNEAKAKAMGFVDRTPYSFAEDLGEIRETMRFIKDPLGSLRRLSQNFSETWRKRKSGLRLANALDTSKAFADVWLTYRFAFSPLLRSIHDAVESASERVSYPPRKVARGKTTSVLIDAGEKQVGVSHTHKTWFMQYSQEIEIKAGILYEVTNPINDWRYKYGLRFKDIPETAWALLPYSFMVDRVTNISQAVRGITSFLDPDVKYRAAWITTKNSIVKSRSLFKQTSKGIPQNQDTISNPDTDKSTDFVYDRAVWVPSLGDAFAPFEVQGLVDDVTKVADLAALILGRIVR